jgi:hypothetical protein
VLARRRRAHGVAAFGRAAVQSAVGVPVPTAGRAAADMPKRGAGPGAGGAIDRPRITPRHTTVEKRCPA